MRSVRWSTIPVLWAAIAILFVGSVVGIATVDAPSDDQAAESRQAELPDGPATTQLRWVLDRLGKGAPEPQLREHFAPSFLASVPAQQLTAILVQLGADGPFTIESADAKGPHSLSIVLAGTKERMTVDIEVEPGAPHRITGLLFQPAGFLEPDESFDAVVDSLHKAAPEVGFLAAEIVDGKCRAVHEVAADQPLALGSAFKLYVLGALAESIQRGDIEWHQMVEIRDDQRVHTSARFGAKSGRDRTTVEALAEAMIQVSDNTATDVVLELVGRRKVESAQQRMGMKDPAANVPFLSTREMTLLKWGRPPLVDDYLALSDSTARRRFLEQKLPKGPATEQDVQFVATPTRVDTVEWFASPSDLCRAHVWLDDLGERKGLEPLRKILGTIPGLRFDPPSDRFAFKGGSEPGVLAGAWLLADREGRRHVIVVLLRNTSGAIDTKALQAAVDAHRLLVNRKWTLR